MATLQAGIIRYGSLAMAIRAALDVDPEPEVRVGQLRLTIIFRRHGATRWPEARRIEYALRVAAATRSVMAKDKRAGVRYRSTRAIVIIYEDASLLRGCAVVSRWECVVPALQPRE